MAVVADFGNCGPGAQRVADMVDAWHPAAVATAGDNTYDVEGCTPFTESVGSYYDEYVDGPAGARFFPALGNHDYEDDGAGLAAYRSFFPYLSSAADHEQRWYETAVGGIRLFVLDSEVGESDLEAQRTWLRGALTSSRSRDPRTWNVVVVHRPAYTSGPHEPATELQRGGGWDLQDWGADLVVAGHQHVYEDVVVDGLHHVTAGIGTNGLSRGGCPSTRVDGSRVCLEGEGAVRLTATPEILTVEYRQPASGEGTVRDTIVLPR